MKVLSSKNGKEGFTSLDKSTPANVSISDIRIDSRFNKEGKVLSTIQFNGCWKKLGLDNHAIIMGASDEGQPALFIVADSNETAHAFKRTAKSVGNKSKAVKADNFLVELGKAGLLADQVDGLVEGKYVTQYLNLVTLEVTEEESAVGILSAYVVISAGVDPTLEDIREIPQSRIDAIMAARAKTRAAKALSSTSVNESGALTA